MGCHIFLPGIFPTQGSNPSLLCLLHCRQILYPLSHQGSPVILKVVPKTTTWAVQSLLPNPLAWRGESVEIRKGQVEPLGLKCLKQKVKSGVF